MRSAVFAVGSAAAGAPGLEAAASLALESARDLGSRESDFAGSLAVAAVSRDSADFDVVRVDACFLAVVVTLPVFDSPFAFAAFALDLDVAGFTELFDEPFFLLEDDLAIEQPPGRA